MTQESSSKTYRPRQAPAGLWPFAYEAAIFDFDGTLSDTASLWHQVDKAFLGERGLPYDDEYPRMLSVLGFEGGARYTIERFGLDESVEDICDEWNRMGRALYATQATLRPGARRYIEALRAEGVPVALATTNDATVLRSMKERVDVDALFDTCVHAADVGAAKDKPDIYLEAARRLDIAPEACIVFEDIEPGLKSARRAGMTACGVVSGDPVQDVSRIRAAADCLLYDWRDIPVPEGGKAAHDKA